MIEDFLKNHKTTLTLLVTAVTYVATDHPWLDGYLPIQGKPLVIFMLISIVIGYELMAAKHAKINGRFNSLEDLIRETARTQEESALRHRINSIYQSFIDSRDEYITNEFTIRQLADLQDTLTATGTNSYSQGQMVYMNNKIEVDHNRRDSDR